MLTFAELKAAERAVLWPSPGESRNLRTAHDRFFAEAMAELSQWVPCLQENNTQVHAACSAFVQCAKTVVPAPVGRIERVYTVANSGYCDRIYYRSRSFEEVEVWSRESMVRWTTPVNTTLPALQEGFAYPDSSNDGHCGRALLGIWAINRGQLHVAPWLESNESLVIEWSGIKKSWADEDIIDEDLWGTGEKEAIRAFAKWKHELYYGCDLQRTRVFEMEFKDHLAMLMYECQKNTEQQHEENTPDVQRFQLQSEKVAAQIPEAVDATLVIANVGDFGVDNANEQAVADLIDTFGADLLISNGDNNYGDDYDQYVGKYYSKWIYPYSGAYEGGAAENLMWPVPGNHDYDVDPESDLRSYLAFFNVPGRYYEKVFGSAHVFFLNSESEEPDGITSTSNQAMWLKAKMALSPATWKIVIIHNAPYTSASADSPGILTSRWPFETWGADLVLSGDSHGYEALKVAGLNFLVNGAGGRTLTTFTPIAESEFLYVGFGAGKMTISCSELKYEFFSVDGVLRHTLTLTKD